MIMTEFWSYSVHSNVLAMIIADRIVAAEYAFMRKLGYSADEAVTHAIAIKADFWGIVRQ